VRVREDRGHFRWEGSHTKSKKPASILQHKNTGIIFIKAFCLLRKSCCGWAPPPHAWRHTHTHATHRKCRGSIIFILLAFGHFPHKRDPASHYLI
jgi:hypothetical protein